MHETNSKLSQISKMFTNKKNLLKIFGHFWVIQVWSVGPFKEALISSDTSISYSLSLVLRTFQVPQEPVFMTGPKQWLADSGIHHRLESFAMQNKKYPSLEGLPNRGRLSTLQEWHIGTQSALRGQSCRSLWFRSLDPPRILGTRGQRPHHIGSCPHTR